MIIICIIGISKKCCERKGISQYTFSRSHFFNIKNTKERNKKCLLMKKEKYSVKKQ